jgi:hypothetical protein
LTATHTATFYIAREREIEKRETTDRNIIRGIGAEGRGAEQTMTTI